MPPFIAKYFKLFKYIVSGGSAAVVNLAILYVLTEYAHIHYLESAVLSFLCAFLVSFLLQKFWTFGNKARERMHWQMASYLAVSLANLGLNTLIIYILVEYLHIWYLFSAVIAGALIAFGSFFIYRHLIFKEYPVQDIEPSR